MAIHFGGKAVGHRVGLVRVHPVQLLGRTAPPMALLTGNIT